MGSGKYPNTVALLSQACRAAATRRIWYMAAVCFVESGVIVICCMTSITSIRSKYRLSKNQESLGIHFP